MDGLFHGKSQLKMDDDWRYPHDFGKLQMARSMSSSPKLGYGFPITMKYPRSKDMGGG